MLKTLDFPLLKIFKGDDEEMFLEEMLIQSVLNVQIEMVKQKFGKVKRKVKDISKFKELQCLGVQLQNLNVTYEDQYAIIHSDYNRVEPDADYCDKIEQGFKDAPLKAMEEFDTPFPGMSGKLPGLKDFKDWAEKVTPKMEDGLAPPTKPQIKDDESVPKSATLKDKETVEIHKEAVEPTKEDL